MQDVDFDAVQVGQLGPRTFDGIRQGIMNDVCCSVSIVNQQGQIGGFSEVSYTASFFDWGSSEFGLHEVGIMSILGGLLSRLSFRQGSDGHAIAACLLGLIVGEVVASWSGAIDGGRVRLYRISPVTRQSVSKRMGLQEQMLGTCLNPSLCLGPFSAWGPECDIRY